MRISLIAGSLGDLMVVRHTTYNAIDGSSCETHCSNDRGHTAANDQTRPHRAPTRATQAHAEMAAERHVDGVQGARAVPAAIGPAPSPPVGRSVSLCSVPGAPRTSRDASRHLSICLSSLPPPPRRAELPP